ncbi:type IV toxin-antitoxin system AbiEi family antitoxin domain-containing protein [Kribbella voronezhensis]|nr:type IV toxin-antitoxin system AbiEi family antitoxin domain-containing protein [Kribbella voronezhensis]
MRELESRLPRTFATRSARALGVHPRDLYRWRDSGQIVELSRGVFRRTDAPAATFPDLLAVAHRVPGGIVCCLSAAATQDLTDELPASVQIAVPRSSRAPQIDYPPTSAFRFDPGTFELGLSRLEAAPDEWVRVYEPARTVVDLMRLRNRWGDAVAYSALQRYLRLPTARPAVLLDYAEKLGVYGPLRAALDVASAG